MPPKKRIKTNKDEDNNAKDSSEFCETELSVPTTEYQPTRLSLLPVDVLLYICEFLLPSDFLSLSQLDEPKINEVVNFQRNASFSACRKTSFELISSYFSRDRVKYIQRLNFNYSIFVRPCDLVQIICKCKNLIFLSIVECGIQHRQVLKILGNCSVLKELTWNVKGDILKKENYHFALTKLFLIYDPFLPFNSVDSIQKIVQSFPKIESAIIYFCPDSLIAPPFIGSWSNTLILSGSDPQTWFDILKNFLYRSERRIPFINRFFHDKVPLDSSEDANIYFNYPPFLKVKTCDLDVMSLSSCNSMAYSSVGIVLTTADPNVYEELSISLPKIAGDKLKHLSFESRTRQSANWFIWYKERLDNESYGKVSDMLETVILNCQNITVLDIGAIHFTSSSPLKAMCHLKNLKVLNMPTCAICKTASKSSVEFEEMVLNCYKVEDFHLLCCKVDIGILCERDILPIKNWKSLRSFTILYVIFRTCNFLRKIADSCQHFQSFSLITTSPDNVCIFYNDVRYLLMNAKNLSFLRINADQFNLDFGHFMKVVGSCKSLEGICIMTKIRICFTTTFLINCIKDLKYLHFFHFFAPNIPECLHNKIKKSMEKNGIKNIHIQNIDHSLFYRRNEIVDGDDYHAEPPFSCKHLHFKPFLLDFMN